MANRESFIDKKIRLMNDETNEANQDFGRKSLECVGFKRGLSRVQTEQAEIKEQQKQLELA